MQDEFYATIKLISGEEIFSLVSVDENDGDPIIILQNPVVMKIMENSYGTYVKIKSWIDISNDDIFIMKVDKLITISEITDQKIIGFYEKYIKSDEEINIEESNKVNLSDKLGYISSVNEARKTLESIFKDF